MIFGNHTVPDLKWLLESRDYFFGQMQHAIGVFYGTWQKNDPKALADWYADYNAFELRYATARTAALEAIDYASWLPGPDDVIGVEPEWIGILRAFQQVDMTRTKGDFGDLVSRLEAAGGHVSFDRIPPDSSVDWDLKAYKTADDVLGGLKAAADAVKSYGFPVAAVVAAVVAGVVVLRVTR